MEQSGESAGGRPLTWLRLAPGADPRAAGPRRAAPLRGNALLDLGAAPAAAPRAAPRAETPPPAALKTEDAAWYDGAMDAPAAAPWADDDAYRSPDEPGARAPDGWGHSSDGERAPRAAWAPPPDAEAGEREAAARAPGVVKRVDGRGRWRRPPRAAPKPAPVVTRADVPLAGRWRVTCALSMPLLQAMQSVLRRWQGAGVVARFDFSPPRDECAEAALPPGGRLWIATEESFCTTMVLCASGVDLAYEAADAAVADPRAGGVLDIAMRRSLFHDAAADSGARLLLDVEEGHDGALRAHLHIPVGASRVCSIVAATLPRVPPRFPFETALLDARGVPVRAHSGAWLCLAVDAARWATARGALPASSTTAVFTLHPIDPPAPGADTGACTPGRVRIDVRTGSDDRRVVELECAHVGLLGPYEAHPFPTSTIKLLSDSVAPLLLCLGPPLYRTEGAYGRARSALIAQATPYDAGHEKLHLAHVTHNADIFDDDQADDEPAEKRARESQAMDVRGARLMQRIAKHRRQKRPRLDSDGEEESFGSD